ncbi:MAG: hypothetical protein ACI4PQ_02390 [Butyricicoccaceae bacterium]
MVTTQNELLTQIYQNTRMGVTGIENVQEHAGTGAFSDALMRQKKEYLSIGDQAMQLMQKTGHTPKDIGMMSRLSSDLMASFHVARDPSISHIAEMMIQGSSMGITRLTKHLNDFSGGKNDPAKSLADKLLHTEQTNIDKMRQFL